MLRHRHMRAFAAPHAASARTGRGRYCAFAREGATRSRSATSAPTRPPRRRRTSSGRSGAEPRPRARQRHVDPRRRAGRRAGASRRARAQRRHRRHPAGPRDGGQALGLDAQRERAGAPRPHARRGPVDAPGSSIVAISSSAPSVCSRTTRSSAPRRRLSRRSSGTSRSSSHPAGSASTQSPRASSRRGAGALPEPRGDARVRGAQPGGPDRDARRRRRRGGVPLLADADMIRGQTVVVDGGWSASAD